MKYSKPKYTSKLKNGKIIIRKWIGPKKEYLGVYETQEDADTVVETCKQYNWDLNNENVQSIINQLRVKTKNYSRMGDRYYVYRTIKGKRIYYDSFIFEEDAIDCVKLLKKLDWNKTVYNELKVLI